MTTHTAPHRAGLDVTATTPHDRIDVPLVSTMHGEGQILDAAGDVVVDGVELAPGERARVRFTVPADLACFTGLRGTRVVEPGAVELRVARSSTDVHTTLALELVGPERELGHDRRLASDVQIRKEQQ